MFQGSSLPLWCLVCHFSQLWISQETLKFIILFILQCNHINCICYHVIYQHGCHCAIVLSVICNHSTKYPYIFILTHYKYSWLGEDIQGNTWVPLRKSLDHSLEQCGSSKFPSSPCWLCLNEPQETSQPASSFQRTTGFKPWGHRGLICTTHQSRALASLQQLAYE